MPERYQREIEDILKQAGGLKRTRQGQKPRQSAWRLIWLYVSNAVGGKAWSLRPSRIMFIAVCLILAALLFGRILAGIGAPLALAGLLLFIVGYGLFFVKPPKLEKHWRGQPLEDAGGGWRDRFRRKLK